MSTNSMSAGVVAFCRDNDIHSCTNGRERVLKLGRVFTR